MVMFEYRRRILNLPNDKSDALYRHNPSTVQNLFAVSVRNSTLTVEKYNMILKVWKHICNIDFRSKRDNSKYKLVWDENFVFCIGGSMRKKTFIRTVSC